MLESTPSTPSPTSLQIPPRRYKNYSDITKLKRFQYTIFKISLNKPANITDSVMTILNNPSFQVEEYHKNPEQYHKEVLFQVVSIIYGPKEESEPERNRGLSKALNSKWANSLIKHLKIDRKMKSAINIKFPPKVINTENLEVIPDITDQPPSQTFSPEEIPSLIPLEEPPQDNNPPTPPVNTENIQASDLTPTVTEPAIDKNLTPHNGDPLPSNLSLKPEPKTKELTENPPKSKKRKEPPEASLTKTLSPKLNKPVKIDPTPTTLVPPTLTPPERTLTPKVISPKPPALSIPPVPPSVITPITTEPSPTISIALNPIEPKPISTLSKDTQTQLQSYINDKNTKKAKALLHVGACGLWSDQFKKLEIAEKIKKQFIDTPIPLEEQLKVIRREMRKNKKETGLRPAFWEGELAKVLQRIEAEVLETLSKNPPTCKPLAELKDYIQLAQETKQEERKTYGFRSDQVEKLKQANLVLELFEPPEGKSPPSPETLKKTLEAAIEANIASTTSTPFKKGRLNEIFTALQVAVQGSNPTSKSKATA